MRKIAIINDQLKRTLYDFLSHIYFAVMLYRPTPTPFPAMFRNLRF
jgi:hypothetical protein